MNDDPLVAAHELLLRAERAPLGTRRMMLDLADMKLGEARALLVAKERALLASTEPFARARSELLKRQHNLGEVVASRVVALRAKTDMQEQIVLMLVEFRRALMTLVELATRGDVQPFVAAMPGCLGALDELEDAIAGALDAE